MKYINMGNELANNFLCAVSFEINAWVVDKTIMNSNQPIEVYLTFLHAQTGNKEATKPIDNMSTLVLVMAWCWQANIHYLNQCWPKYMLPYVVTRSQWHNTSYLTKNSAIRYNNGTWLSNMIIICYAGCKSTLYIEIKYSNMIVW